MYANYKDVEKRLNKMLTADEQALCVALLEDAAVIVDAYNSQADRASKSVVSCRMVIRAIGNSGVDVPIGATQGSMSALGYSQSWTMSNGSTGELYLSKLDKKLLKCGDKIGASNPLEAVL